MALKNTNLLIQMSEIPQTFRGSPQQLAEEMVRRFRIVSPSGTNFFFVGNTEPTSNVGPWLREGTQWWVFDEELKRYQPQDISASETTWFFFGAATPESVDPPVWLRTTKNPTEEDPSSGNVIGWYLYNGTAWVPFNGIVESGPTETRPAAPFALQQYYDTTISVLIWWERNAWRTVGGSPGDVKAVFYDTLENALLVNPGWEVLGASNQSIRGRWISQATKDAGAAPAIELSVASGIAPRGAKEVYGETDGIQIDSSSDVPFPPTIAFWHLIKL